MKSSSPIASKCPTPLSIAPPDLGALVRPRLRISEKLAPHKAHRLAESLQSTAAAESHRTSATNNNTYSSSFIGPTQPQSLQASCTQANTAQ
jgi:hypothetical protein